MIPEGKYTRSTEHRFEYGLVVLVAQVEQSIAWKVEVKPTKAEQPKEDDHA